ncbi:D-hexose-6-phosphate mutarotase [Ferrimonas sediminicola]|uniref:Putative glucose-6-phosphate 1-epimerase n=1 Tax=Ferrimonas sediminicola TaxID=2569538 RepID=A0A4U1BIE4_9GAMM|nr:D-hexose-6-phosphate mutarotase [Ferrimonas sediminicola]TKB50319.1 D-hexose-6-phosphate mutarotase [Ferrimonas sediminicola]
MYSGLHLVSQKGLTDSVIGGTLQGGLPVLVVQNRFARAVISLFGAQLLSFIPAGQREWLWLSQKAHLDQTRPIRGGIPICWPWFGARPGPQPLPSHGFARNHLWQLDGISEQIQGTIVSLFLSDDQVKPDYWPYAYELQLDIHVSHQLGLTLTCHNCDRRPWHFAAALHSYFNVGQVQSCQVHGLGGRYRDKLSGQSVIHPGVLQVRPPLDRIYPRAEPQVVLATPNRSLLLDQVGMDSVVVWHPGRHVPGDMEVSQGESMLCVETALLGDQGVLLAPGQAQQLAVTISRQR